MKLRLLACGFALGLGAAMITSQAMSQDTPSPDDMQKMMEIWMKAMTPGEKHKAMERAAGTWNSTTRIWMAGPDSEPTITTGTSIRKSVLGGRFIHQEDRSKMMMPDPATGAMNEVPWDGMGLFGFDNNRNMYVGCWADTMGTQLLTMKGTATPDGKTITMFGEMDEPMLGMYGRLVKYVTHIVDADTERFEVYDLAVSDDYKVVEVTYRRQK